MLKYFFIFLFAISSRHCFSQYAGIKECYIVGYSSNGNYHGKRIRQLNELPPNIQNKLHEYLVSYLGNEFYSKIRFEGGRLLERDKLYKKDPRAREFRWTLPTYDLDFSISIPISGIFFYCSKVTLDSIGNVTDREIEFPKYKENAKSCTFLNISTLKKIADSLGYPTDNYDMSCYKGHIILIFKRGLTRFSAKKLYLSIHTGEIILEFTDSWIE